MNQCFGLVVTNLSGKNRLDAKSYIAIDIIYYPYIHLSNLNAVEIVSLLKFLLYLNKSIFYGIFYTIFFS